MCWYDALLVFVFHILVAKNKAKTIQSLRQTDSRAFASYGCEQKTLAEKLDFVTLF